MRSLRTPQRLRLLVVSSVVLHGCLLCPQEPVLTETRWTQMPDETSGMAPYENVRSLTRLHRVPATRVRPGSGVDSDACQGIRTAGCAHGAVLNRWQDSLWVDALASCLACGGGQSMGGCARAHAAGRLVDRADPASGRTPHCALRPPATVRTRTRRWST